MDSKRGTLKLYIHEEGGVGKSLSREKLFNNHLLRIALTRHFVKKEKKNLISISISGNYTIFQTMKIKYPSYLYFLIVHSYKFLKKKIDMKKFLKFICELDRMF